jgi:WhiB family transcriptional regulator, redox-sensing transcriptional regulator
MTRRRVEQPGQLELAFDPPALSDDVSAELAADAVPGWRRMAACRSVGDDTWFPHRTVDPRSALAERAGCPVRRSCLAHSLGIGEGFGIWGGTTEATRYALRLDLADGVPVARVLGWADAVSESPRRGA